VIDDWIDGDDWPDVVQSAVGEFEQGDLIERPGFFYLASAAHGVWRLTRETGDSTQPDELFELDPEDAPPFGMITTETCDLVEEDGNPRQPWISVAPVYTLAMLDINDISLLDSGRVAYMRRLTAAQFESAIWVVDGRIEFPVEKSWLVGRQPIQAFATPDEKIAIARFFAGRRERPVLAQDVHKHLLTPARRWIERKSAPAREQVLAGIFEIRLRVAGDLLRPDGLSLIIVGDSQPVSESVRKAWDSKFPGWRDRLEAAGIALLPHEYATLDTLSARTYTNTYRIPLEFALS
jgi:hypothetical protein